MKADNPMKYPNITDYLVAQGFTIGKEGFYKADITIPFHELQRHSPVTFAQKAKEKGWIGREEDSSSSTPFPYYPTFI